MVFMQTNSILTRVTTTALNFLSQAHSPSLRSLTELRVEQRHKFKGVHSPGQNPQWKRDKCPSSLSFRGTILRRNIHGATEGWALVACNNSKELRNASYIGFSPSCLSNSPDSHLPRKLPVPKSLPLALFWGLRGAIWLEEWTWAAFALYFTLN